MQVGAVRFPVYAAGIAVIAAAAAGCAASSTSSAGVGTSAAAAAVSPLQAVKLAAQTTDSVNSFSGTMNLRATVKPGSSISSGAGGDLTMAATFAEEVRPTRLVSMDITTLSTQGTAIPGGLAEIITPTAIYLKWPTLTQQLHTTKPWLSMSLSSLSKTSGLNLDQLSSQSNSPLTQAQMFAGATSVRQVGTTTLDGVPVTEYTGTVPMDKALSRLSGTTKTQVQQQIATAGLTDEQFTAWIDDQHHLRKAIVTVHGTSITETITMTVTSINQPVNITVPPASQTTAMPGKL